jgi:hypothetical protein
MRPGFPFSRRRFLALAAAPAAARGAPLGRRAVVDRHAPTMRELDPRSPLAVGNGEMAFTADVTGMQSLAPAYERDVPLCTQSQWGWHSFPIPQGLDPRQLRLEMFDTYGRQVGYATSSRGQEALFNWLRENPHRMNLGRIGLLLDGDRIAPSDIGGIEQRLDLWNGVLESRFLLRGQPVRVSTRCDPARDCLAFSVESPLAVSARLSIEFTFPYGSTAMNASDWASAAKHRTSAIASERRSMTVERELDDARYWVRLNWSGDASARQSGAHTLLLSGKVLEFTCEFAQQKFAQAALSAAEVKRACEAHWPKFWSSGGAIDLAGSADRRAEELERRIVLSQYLTAIQCAGSLPPQETGLTCNSWYGKFHLEMHWWHAAHFALWGRTPLLERSIGWYGAILASARAKAAQQGYPGARWPKMTAPDGRSSPSNIGELLIWQQPHPIALCELCYRAHPRRETLERYADAVMDSAEFMAGFAAMRDGWYALGPPVIPAQENHPPRDTWNPTFELTYWREALETAQAWRERLGLKREPRWEEVRTKLAPLPARDGVYLAHENCPQTYTERNRDHPSMLAALGVLKGAGVDRETMRRTLAKVMSVWHWEDAWGWDFPMAAMTAARLGDAETAVDALFLDSPKNTWLKNGHCWQRADLPVYLPANGGLLTATAMMAAAWNGFAAKGWNARWEGLEAWM